MHKRQFAFAIAVAFIAGAFSSCSHLAKAQPMEGTSIAVQILATVRLVSTENILESTFREDVAKLEASRGKALSAEERSLYLEDVINDILFYQMCERDGIKVSDGEIDAYIAKLRLQRPPEETEDEFKAFLVKQGVEYEDLRTNYKKQVLIQRWLMSAKAAEISTELAVQTKEILDMYELYKSKLVRPDTVKLSFLLSQYKDGSEEERARSQALIKGLEEKLAAGATFDTLRLQALEGGYAANKEPVYFERSDVFINQFGKEFFDMAFSMADGDVSPAFGTKAGWWIIKRLEFLPQKQLELSDPYRLGQPGTVQEYIAQELSKAKEAEFLGRTFKELFIKLREQAEIQIIGTP